jgi:hypothetical protein
MSEPKTDPGRKTSRADSPNSDHRKAGRQHTDTAIPIPDRDADVLGDVSPPTDDAPTIVSKNSPRPPGLDNGIRGRRLAHFELIEQIGAGGMAAVLRARDTQLDRIVALKILPPDLAGDGDNVHRFHQEARSAAKLDHENIARVFFCGEDQRLHFIAFEYVDGENLRVILEKRGRLTVHEALPYIIQVAAGLAHAAERGVVHRDIKPSNIIITPAGRAKLVDMGLARSLGSHKDHGLTQSGVTLGTFDYISPEQALEPRDADVRSDIYSLGCTFYHMLTGRPPVPEGTAAKKLHCHQHVPPPDPRELVPDLPDEVVVILDRMMAKDPRLRYQTAGELVQHLLTAAKKLHVGADVPEGVLFVEASLPRSSGGRPYFLVGLAVAAVVAVVVALDQPTRPPVNQVVKGDSTAPNKIGRDTVPPKDGPTPIPVQVKQEETFDWKKDTKPEEITNWVAGKREVPLLRIKVADDVTVTAGETPGFSIRAPEQQVIIEAKDATRRPTIKLEYVKGALQPGDTWVALLVQARSTTVSGIRFVLDTNGANPPLVGLQLSGGENDVVRGCRFDQLSPSSFNNTNRLVSLLLTGASNRKLKLKELSDVVFCGQQRDLPGLPALETGGQDAIVCRGACIEKGWDCAFFPHQAAVRVEGDDDVVKLTHCSFMMGASSSVFHLCGKRADVTLKRSVVAIPPGFKQPTVDPPAELIGDVLIRVAKPMAEFAYTGEANAYYHLTAYLATDTEVLKADLPAFKSYLADASAEKTGASAEEKAKELAAYPWPGQLEVRTVNQPPSTSALQLDQTLVDLWWKDKEGPGYRPAGVEKLEGKSWAVGIKPGKPETMERETVVVDPSGTKGTYRTLRGAAQEKPNSTILLHHNGELVEEIIALETAKGVDLVIRPDAGCHPVLTLNKTQIDKQAALLKLRDGKVQFENLEIRLAPSAQENFQLQAIVALLGDGGQCTFKDCVLTLDAGDSSNPLPLAVAMLPGTGELMKMDGMAPRPDIKPGLRFDNCLVRGGGDLVADPSGRQFAIGASNVVVALTGSFLKLECGSAPQPGDTIEMTLGRVTTWLGGPFLYVQGQKGLSELMRITISAEGCFFTPASTEVPSPFARFEVPGGYDDDQLRMRLLWTPRANAFGPFKDFVDWQTGKDMIQSKLVESGWKEHINDRNIQSRFQIALAEGISADMKPVQILPEKLRPSDLPEYGADLAILNKGLIGILPRP